MKKRIFSTNDILNYKDVYSLKNGTEILKTIKREENLAIIGQFKNYQQLHVLHQAYYPFLDNHVFIVDNVQNIVEANESFVDNPNKYVHPINCCKPCLPDPCCKPCCKPVPVPCCEPPPCKLPLSEKGHILKKKPVIPCSNTSSALYVCRWNHAPCRVRPENPFQRCHCTKPTHKCECYTTCGCSLCKNAKPLFI